jgi:hypothetical protein
MYSTGPSPFFTIVALVLVILNIWATIIVIRAGSRYLDRTRPPRQPRPERTPLFPKEDPPKSE